MLAEVKKSRKFWEWGIKFGGATDNGGLVVGVVKCSGYSRFKLINGGVDQADEVEFWKVWCEVWQKVKDGKVMVMSMPSKSVVWRWKKVKEDMRINKAKSIEVMDQGVKWRVVTNCDEMVDGMRVLQSGNNVVEKTRGCQKKMDGVRERVYE